MHQNAIFVVISTFVVEKFEELIQVDKQVVVEIIVEQSEELILVDK